MRKTSLLIIGFAFLAQISFAQKADMPHMPMHGKCNVKNLNLTQEQEKKFDELTTAHQKAMVDIKANIQKNQIELHSMIKSGSIDDKKLLDLTNANSKLQAEIKESGIKKWIEINKMLDKDQKVVWAKHLGRMAGGAMMMKERMKAGARDKMMKRGMRENMMEHRAMGREMMKGKEPEK